MNPFNRKLVLSGILGSPMLPLISLLYMSLREIVLTRFSSYTLESWISFLLGISVFYCFLYRFLKKYKKRYTLTGLWMLGATWVLIAVGFNSFLAYFVYYFSLSDILATYHVFKGEPWGWILLAIFISPRLMYSLEKA
jgi:hypothetical protein